VVETNWRNYGLSQSKGSFPSGPMVLAIHMASVWVPFTSESKEAIAHYPEIIKQIKLSIQEVGRKLAGYIRRTVRVKEQKERLDLFEKYIPEISTSVSKLTKEKRDFITAKLSKTLKRSLKELIPEVEGEEKPKKKPTKEKKKHVKKEKQTTLKPRRSR
jgi:DNA topoisomerase-6 subunit B